MNNNASEYEDLVSESDVELDDSTLEIDRHETSQSLDQAITQIDIALNEADHSVAQLIGAMTSMACCVHRIDQQLVELRQYPKTDSAADEIEKNCKQAEADMQKAVMAFQFYDRLSQRFMHIYENLHAVSDVIKAPDNQHPELWQSLRDNVHSVYSSNQQQRIQQSSNENITDNKITEHDAEDGKKSADDFELF